MSATEDDTELRDLLIQNLENSGVLNKLKAEMRAAVFLAMDEQDKLENKTPLINENLKKSLLSRDGRLVASLILDFLQVFNLDFTLAVFQPEINSLNGLDSRDLICRDLDLSESEVNKNCPLLLELVKRGRRRPAQEPSPKQIALARKNFDFYDKGGSGSVAKEDLKSVFTDLCPSLNKNMLERFLTDELRAADKTFSKTIDFQVFLGLYKRLFAQCTSVVVQDSDVGQPQSRLPEDRTSSPPASKIPRYRGQIPRGQSQTAAKDSDGVTSLGKGGLQQPGSKHSEASDSRTSSSGPNRERLDRDQDLDLEVEDDPDDGDSFFDDPLPKPQKTYGCPLTGEKDSSERTDGQKDVVSLREEGLSGPVSSPMRRGRSLSDLSVLAADSEGDREDPLSELRKVEASGARGAPAGSLSEAPRPGGGGSSMSEQSHSRNASGSRERGSRDSRALNDKTGSLHFDDDVEYDDDFNSHRSDLSKSELSIGEEIEEVSIEGPDNSDKFDDTTQDLSVSQLSQNHGADYMEEVA
ncbi:FGFR1 oncogene partner isoform X2 [Micropterus salmoides]|uniref:FGFR1 oncogene partner isoform X2 n=1 Tax=Micropterus salmoides TaxID=27706 RepID=UPI0018EC8134|nr:FGFR1 oncogene partner isoform X2 [Micropterus salmoides]